MKFFGWLTVCLLLLAGVGAYAQMSAPASAPSESAPASSPLVVRIDSVAPVKIQSDGGAPWWTGLSPVIGNIISGAVALITVIWSLQIARDNTVRTTEASKHTSEAAIWQKANEAEIKDIQAKLDGFYMPFWLLSKANKLLADDVKSRQQADYRLLVKLFDRQWRLALSPGDQKLVDMLCSNAEELRALIVAKAGLVDGAVLEYLSRASVHFRILHLVSKNELGSDPSGFLKYVYPRQLDGVLEAEIDRLNVRAQQLRERPGERHPPPPQLVIPSDLKLPAWADAAA